MKQGRLILIVGLVVLCVLSRQAEAQQVVYAIKPQPPSCPAVSDYGSNGLNFCYDGTLYFWNGSGWVAVTTGPPAPVSCSQLPALTGDVTSSAGSCATTATKAGGGTGNFQAGSLGVGFTPDGTSGDILANDGISVGSLSVGVSPGSGKVVIDNNFLCNNANNVSVDCLTASNGAGTFSLISITASNGFQFGSLTGPGIVFATSGTNSISFIVGTLNALSATSSGMTISNGFAGALRLTGGSLLSMTGGTRPTVSCGGVAGTVGIGVSTDNKGIITTPASAQTTCTLTFNHTWPQAPICQWTDGNASITPVAFSAGATSISSAIVDFASATSTKIIYHCF